MSGNLNYVRIALVSSMLTVAGNVCAQTVKGNVKDNTGEPIIGATVIEDGASGNGAVTDIDGNFTINLKGKSNKVKISYVGMKTKTINVAGKSNIDVKLEDDAQNLNDVVVIGYGTVRKKDLTGSVSSISADDIAGVPVSNVGEAMTGKLAGVNITTTEGSPDADVKIRVRGGGSLSQDNSPLYIVDGFPVSSISDIAPSEIESIDVLKDASSTAIYGARGANGV
ncbi:MAG: TonB-dependent receptor plug domain-containing protein, partial [Prevotella sp.]|nr:TonB-dependent receptor plug domain-containing protein [Prevotella sp.]